MIATSSQSADLTRVCWRLPAPGQDRCQFICWVLFYVWLPRSIVKCRPAIRRWVEQKKKFTEEEARVMQNVRHFPVPVFEKARVPHPHDVLR